MARLLPGHHAIEESGPAFEDTHDFENDGNYAVPGGNQDHDLYAVTFNDANFSQTEELVVMFADPDRFVFARLAIASNDDSTHVSGTGAVCIPSENIGTPIKEIRVNGAVTGTSKIKAFDF